MTVLKFSGSRLHPGGLCCTSGVLAIPEEDRGTVLFSSGLHLLVLAHFVFRETDEEAVFPLEEGVEAFTGASLQRAAENAVFGAAAGHGLQGGNPCAGLVLRPGETLDGGRADANTGTMPSRSTAHSARLKNRMIILFFFIIFPPENEMYNIFILYNKVRRFSTVLDILYIKINSFYGIDYYIRVLYNIIRLHHNLRQFTQSILSRLHTQPIAKSHSKLKNAK